jgi:hypothetical protein
MHRYDLTAQTVNKFIVGIIQQVVYIKANPKPRVCIHDGINLINRSADAVGHIFNGKHYAALLGNIGQPDRKIC